MYLLLYKKKKRRWRNHKSNFKVSVHIESSSQLQILCLKETDILVFRALELVKCLQKTHIQFTLCVLPLTIHWGHIVLKHKFHENCWSSSSGKQILYYKTVYPVFFNCHSLTRFQCE